MKTASFRLWAITAMVIAPFISFAQQSEREIEVIKISSNQTINCTSDPVTIGVRIDNWQPGTSFLWSDGLTDSFRIVKPDESTTYQLTVLNDGLNFQADFDFEVAVKNRMILTRNLKYELPNTKCIGEPVALEAKHRGGHAPFEYAWPDGSDAKTNVLDVDHDQQFLVTITDACGTTAEKGINISIAPRLPVKAPAQLLEYYSCDGDEIALSPTLIGVEGGVGHGYHFTFSSWDQANEALTVLAEEGLAVPVKITDACQNDMVSVEITLKKSAIEIPEIQDLIVCKRDTTNIVQDVPAQVYFWNGNGFSANYEMAVDRNTNVALTYIDRCSDQHGLKRHITVREPLADFDYKLENSTGKVVLDNFSGGEQLRYSWSVNGVAVSTEPNPNILLEPETENEVTLVVTDDQNCEATLTRRIAAVQNNSFPTAFTPNGDGRNDTYSIHIEEELVTFHFEVFDRWGQLIFATNDQYFTWDGRHGSSQLPLDTYVFKMQGETNAGDALEKLGTITILNNRK